MPTSVQIAFALAACVWFVLRLIRAGQRERGLPPGPPTVPILGNLLAFPTEHAHLKMTQWAKTYGDIYSLKLGSSTVIVISSAAAVKSLIDKRGATTSDRPSSHMVEYVTDGLTVALCRYPDPWRPMRKTLHALLTPQSAARHLHVQIAEAAQLAYDILKKPEEFYTHTRRYSVSVILSILWGKRCPRYETREATAFFESQEKWEYAMAVGAHPPVDVFPILKYVPERWASWKTLARETRKLQKAVYFGLLEDCEAQDANTGCFMEEVLKRRQEFGLTRAMVGYIGGVLMEGAADTTSAFIHTVILMLAAFPDVQHRAHEEMDRVVSGRMPTPDDFENLPYIQAIIKETHRFRPVAPLAIPHATIADEEYGGYLIPKGSTVFVNTYGIFHDEDLFENPNEFQPARFLQSEYGTKPGADDRDLRHNLPFGGGRRICPGIHVANNSLMVNTMNLIWAFDFKPEVDRKTGLSLPVDIDDFHVGLLTGPRPFKCTITPRSANHARLVEERFNDAIDVFLPFEERLDESDKAWVKETRRV
ncbi:hypothetical protein PLICRDRAFT_693091 [Plicaturopsis crispa FD-325 SS-3]|nr:hypothetical protein PLICRDRAFT_693091 [Plicaturopsis crispa FD-325 SS-3]